LVHAVRPSWDGPSEVNQSRKERIKWSSNRKYAISEANLTTSLGNCQTSGHRKIFWKELPKQDRSIGPGAKINHALVNKSDEGFMPRSQTNRTARQVMEDNRPKTETQPTPVSIHVEYKAKAESVQGRHAWSDRSSEEALRDGSGHEHD